MEWALTRIVGRGDHGHVSEAHGQMAQRQYGSDDEGEKVRVWRPGRHARGRDGWEWFLVKVKMGEGPGGSSERN